MTYDLERGGEKAGERESEMEIGAGERDRRGGGERDLRRRHQSVSLSSKFLQFE